MQVLHTHWQPPSTPTEAGHLILWAEDATLPAPRKRRGRVSKNPKPKPHPFTNISSTVLDAVELTGLGDQVIQTTDVILQLPTGGYGPYPSPQLQYTWNMDNDAPSGLAPWKIPGLALTPQNAITFLTRLPAPENLPPSLVLGTDCQFWRMAADLLLETMAAQKLLPTLTQLGGSSQAYHARWLPILDGPHDSQRLSQLQSEMPALCRAEADDPTEAPASRILLDSFINSIADTLARQWGQDTFTGLPSTDLEPAHHWLTALVSPDPSVSGSSAQLRHLHRSFRAWLRNLYVAGDKTSRVAFRLEAPLQQTNGQGKNWSLQFALQARDDPSLLVMADQVWQTTGQVLQTLDRQFERPQEKLLY